MCLDSNSTHMPTTTVTAHDGDGDDCDNDDNDIVAGHNVLAHVGLAKTIASMYFKFT